LVKQQNPKTKIIYAPVMDFVRNITTSLRHKTIENIKSYYQSADLLLVDDIHLIAGKEKSQEEFFHIFNLQFVESHHKQFDWHYPLLNCQKYILEIKELSVLCSFWLAGFQCQF
jgi:chromosomal replication initiator protein